MGINYTLTAYCADCGWDFSESDSDDLDDLVLGSESKAEIFHQEHVRSGLCKP